MSGLYSTTAVAVLAILGAARFASSPRPLAPRSSWNPFELVSVSPSSWPTIPGLPLNTRDLHASSVIVRGELAFGPPTSVDLWFEVSPGSWVLNVLPVSGSSVVASLPNGRVEWSLTTPHQITPGIAPGRVGVTVSHGYASSNPLAGRFP